MNSIEPEALSIPQACVFVGVGRTVLYGEISKGTVRARKVGRRTLLLRGDLVAWLQALPLAASFIKAA